MVPKELDGVRVDRALAILLKVSRSVARELVETGVILDDQPVRANQRVRAGSVLVAPAPPPPEVLEPEPVPFEVLYEDDHLIVVDKPAGIVVHPGAGHSRGTLAAGLLYRYPELVGVGAEGRWGLIHRLDRDTSGVLVVARSEDAYRALTTMMHNREITREYLALVEGTFDAPTGAIDAPIGRHPTHPTRQAVVPAGRPALTRYEVESAYAEAGCSLLRVTLETGRTHQIRVHFAAIGHPVVGDRVYARAPAGIASPRIFLHALRVELTHPNTGDHLIAEAPLPEDLVAVLTSLETENRE